MALLRQYAEINFVRYASVRHYLKANGREWARRISLEKRYETFLGGNNAIAFLDSTSRSFRHEPYYIAHSTYRLIMPVPLYFSLPLLMARAVSSMIR